MKIILIIEMTSNANKADDLVSENDVLDDEHLYILKSLSDALKLVANKKMDGCGGKTGSILLEGLPTKESVQSSL